MVYLQKSKKSYQHTSFTELFESFTILARKKFRTLIRLFAHLLLGFISTSIHAENFDREVSFTSTPSGVFVCRRIAKKEECFGRTPLQLELTFFNKNESKRIFLKKLGYKTDEVLIETRTNSISATLHKQEIFYSSTAHQSEHILKIYEKLKLVIRNILDSFEDVHSHSYSIVDKIRLSGNADSLRLIVSVLVNEERFLKKLKKARRIRNENHRFKSLMEAFNNHGIFKFSDAVTNGIALLPIKEVEFRVLYPRSRAKLGFKKVENLIQHYVGSNHNFNTGVVTHRYELHTASHDTTVVNNEDSLTEYRFLTDVNKITKGNSGLFENLAHIQIISNDNRKHEFTSIMNQ